MQRHAAHPQPDAETFESPVPHDIALRAAIAAAAGTLRFDNRPGSIQRQCTLGLFVAALSDRLALAFPQSADALKAIVFCPSTHGNPTSTTPQQPERHA